MSIIRIRDAEGNVKEILALKGTDGWLTEEAQQILDGKLNAVYTPDDVGKTFMIDENGSAVLTPNDVGSAKDAFQVDFIRANHEELEGSFLEKDAYFLDFEFDSINNKCFMGKTIHIRTYAYGNMSYYLCNRSPIDGGYGQLTIDYVVESHVINPNVDVNADPMGGVCEFEISIPSEAWGDYTWCICVDYVDNPYAEFEAWEVKETVWDEIGKLAANSLLSFGESNGWTYRKWANGFAECWYAGCFNGELQVDSEDYDTVYCTVPLPFPFITARCQTTFTAPPREVEGEDDPIETDRSPTIKQYYVFENDTLELYVQVEKGVHDFEGCIYVAGVWG